MAVATTLNRPTFDQEVAVCCINLSSEPQELKARIAIGIYQPVKEDQIKRIDVWAKSVLPGACPEPVARCSGHVRLLLVQAKLVCKSEDQYARLAGLLSNYQNKFSQGKSGVRPTALSSCWIVLDPSNSHSSNWEWKKPKNGILGSRLGSEEDGKITGRSVELSGSTGPQERPFLATCIH